MPEHSSLNDRSLSRDLDDSDLDDLDGHADSGHAGKPGRKKNANSQAARRDQNRIAQREFRLRKQQRVRQPERIRDLEARVEILSGSQDDALIEIRAILKDLMDENQVLRGLIRSLSGFIQEGAGGLLHKLGWQLSDFDEYVNRSETDTAWESFQRHKKAKEAAATAAGGGGGSGTSSSKRTSTDDMMGPPSKRPRVGSGMQSNGNGGERTSDFNMLLPINTNNSDGDPLSYSSSSRAADNGILPASLIRAANNSPIFMQPDTPNSAQFGPSGAGYPSFVPPPLSMNVESHNGGYTSSNGPSPNSVPESSVTPDVNLPDTIYTEDKDPKKEEAYKLIHYNLDNYKRNTAYCLPASLRPTLVQRTVPHESVVDRILHPELRDRMILLRGRFNLVECLMEYRHEVIIHGDDVLVHQNWEISEKWLRKYGFLVDQATLNITNKWRQERGDPEITLTDIGTQDSAAT